MSRKKVILNLDDEPDVTELIEVTLAPPWQDPEYELLTFNDPLTALEKLKHTKRLDLAIINLKMPKMDGFEVTKRVKKMFPKCKIIMQSFRGDSATLEGVFEAGVDDFIVKPFEPNKLRQRVQKHLQ